LEVFTEQVDASNEWVGLSNEQVDVSNEQVDVSNERVALSNEWVDGSNERVDRTNEPVDRSTHSLETSPRSLPASPRSLSSATLANRAEALAPGILPERRPVVARRMSWQTAVLALSIVASPALATPPAVGTAFVSVQLDGVRLGEDFTANFHSLFPSVVYDPAAQIFHLWVFDGSGFQLAAIRHATSADGVHFTSLGNLSYAGGPPFPGHGAATEPTMQFFRAVHLGSDWKLLMWTPFDGTANNAINGDYNYNVSVNDLGASPNALAVTHEGPVYPVPGGTSGLTNSPWGLIGGFLFVEWDNLGGVGRYSFTDGAPPTAAGPVAARDLITGTGYVYGLSNPSDPLAVYPHNVGRTLDQEDGTYGTFWSFRFWQTGARVNKQIYYSESNDGGATWSNPAGLFADGNLVTVDGAPNQELFSHPEAVAARGARILYFSTRAADGHFVVVTNAPTALQSIIAVPALSPAGAGAWITALLAAGLILLRRRKLL